MSVRQSPLEATWPSGSAIAGLAMLYLLAALPLAVGPSLPAQDVVAGAFLAGFLIVLSAIDLRSFRLPNKLTLPLIAAGIAASQLLGWDTALARVIAAAVGFLSLAFVRELYFRLRARHGLGLGDAKLLAAGGAWAGLPALPSILLAACALALFAVAALKLSGRKMSATTAIPFGPFLAAAIWLVWLHGAPGLK